MADDECLFGAHADDALVSFFPIDRPVLRPDRQVLVPLQLDPRRLDRVVVVEPSRDRLQLRRGELEPRGFSPCGAGDIRSVTVLEQHGGPLMLCYVSATWHQNGSTSRAARRGRATVRSIAVQIARQPCTMRPLRSAVASENRVESDLLAGAGVETGLVDLAGAEERRVDVCLPGHCCVYVEICV